MLERGVDWTDPSLEASLPALQAAGVDLVVEAAWIPRGDKDPRGTALGKLRLIRNMVQQSGHAAAIAMGPEQAERIVAEGRIAVVLGLEGGSALVRDEETLNEFRDLGLSVLGLTWSESSRFADASADPRPGDKGGLSESGRRLVAAANERGILLDVSHMSDRATAETVAASRAPVIASHSNLRRLCDEPRNLPDELARAIAERGGLVGVMFHGPFLACESPAAAGRAGSAAATTGRPASRHGAVAQALALVELLGAEHVAIGSDWDGRIQAPDGLRGSRDLPDFLEDLRVAGLSDAQVATLSGASFLRAWREAWAVRAPAREPAAAP
jgi:membrane dipeptidase